MISVRGMQNGSVSLQWCPSKLYQPPKYSQYLSSVYFFMDFLSPVLKRNLDGSAAWGVIITS